MAHIAKLDCLPHKITFIYSLNAESGFLIYNKRSKYRSQVSLPMRKTLKYKTASQRQ